MNPNPPSPPPTSTVTSAIPPADKEKKLRNLRKVHLLIADEASLDINFPEDTFGHTSFLQILTITIYFLQGQPHAVVKVNDKVLLGSGID